MVTTSERFTKLEQQVAQLTRIAGSTEILAQRLIASEQSITSIGRMLGNIFSVLANKGFITDDEVFAETLKMEERNDRQEVEALVKTETVVSVEEVGEKSFVVVSQEIEGEPTSKIDYRLYKLAAGGLPESFIEDMKGRKIGEELITKIENDKLLKVKILEAYNLNMK